LKIIFNTDEENQNMIMINEGATTSKISLNDITVFKVFVSGNKILISINRR
jgi:hypothetical protein